MKKVFISYSRRDNIFAERLARDLDGAGLDIWIDFREIQGGDWWRDKIFKGIEQAEALIVILSDGSVESEWVRREVLMARSQHKFVIPIMLVDCFDALEKYEETKWLKDIQIIDFETQTYERAFTQLLAALPGATESQDAEVDAAKITSPFKGLESFQETDANLFFGREDLIERILERLRNQHAANTSRRFMAIVGASGSGKSSLARAGLLPHIRSNALPESETWPIVTFSPGPRPIEAMATRLLPIIGGNRLMPELIQLLESHPATLHQLVEGVLTDFPNTARFVLLIDQFEEAFTHAQPKETAVFLQLLHHAATVSNGRTLVIVTMRADFFDRLSGHPDIATLFEQDNLVIMTEMRLENLRRSIEGPAERVGLTYDDGLVDRILEDVSHQPGALPLLQYTLQTLFDRREGRKLTRAAYNAVGGVQRALGQRAEDVFVALDPPLQDIMRRILLRLVEVDQTGTATRRKVNRAELAFDGIAQTDVTQVLDRLLDPDTRLLITSREIRADEAVDAEPTIWIDISHEALIREWPRFQDWVLENEDELRYGSKVLGAAQDWVAANRDNAYLLTGTRLARAEAWLEAADATELQRTFIHASGEEAKTQAQLESERQARELELQRKAANRLRDLAVALSLFLLAASGLLGLTYYLFLEAQDQRSNAIEQAEQARIARDLAQQRADEVQSFSLNEAAVDFSVDDRLLALALAVEANSIENPPIEARRVLAELGYAAGAKNALLAHTDRVRSVAVSPDGTRIVSGSYDGTAIVWDAVSGEPLRIFDVYDQGVRSVAVSPDSRRIITAGCGGYAEGNPTNCVQGEFKLWDIETGTLVRTFYGHDERINSVAFSPDGSQIVSGSYDRRVIVWDTATAEIAVTFDVEHQDAVWSVAFSPDGTQVLSGSDDNTLILWDVATGKSIARYEAAEGGLIRSAAFHPRLPRALTGSSDGTLTLWDLEQSGSAARLVERYDVGAFNVTFSPDGRYALSGGGENTITLWDANSLEPVSTLYGHTAPVLTVAFNPANGDVISGADDGTILVWEKLREDLIAQLSGHGRTVTSVAFSPDGTQALSASADSTLRVWDIATQRTIQMLRGHTDQVTSAVFSPDGMQALSGSWDQTLILWDVASGDQIRTFTGHTDQVTSVALSPDGTQALSGSLDQTLILWDVATGDQIRTFTGHTDQVTSVALSPDGTQVLSGSLDQTLILWDVASGDQIRTFTGHTDQVTSVTFSPDGTQALSGSLDQTLILWDVASGDQIRTFTGTLSGISSVAFNPDGRTILSGAVNNDATLWEVATANVLYVYAAEGSFGIKSVAFNADGTQAITGGFDQIVRVWRVVNVTPDETITWVLANRYVRELTCDERIRYFLDDGSCSEVGTAP